ncbi:protein of unknown function [Candidatus Methylocalor cossyra]|uniref:Uncharacterized protein n=1 Tax=Candidatus Methylocalor cossyra TaxID=3108543 RepID=A0ABM9NJ26_9GAMM
MRRDGSVLFLRVTVLIGFYFSNGYAVRKL